MRKLRNPQTLVFVSMISMPLSSGLEDRGSSPSSMDAFSRFFRLSGPGFTRLSFPWRHLNDTLKQADKQMLSSCKFEVGKR